MTSRERVQAALRHEEPDRVPLDLGGNQSGITCGAYEALLRALGRDEELVVMDTVQQLAQPSDAVLDLLGVDTRYLRAKGAESAPVRFEEQVIRGRPYLSMTDEFGVVWSRPLPDGLYHDITHHPLAGATTVAEIEAYPWPDGGDPTRFADLADEAAKLQAATDQAICTGISGVVYEYCWYLLGFARFYEALVTEPHLVEALLEQTLRYWLDFESGFLAAVGPYVDVVMVGDDLAGQDGPLLSPTLYRRLVKPRQARLYELIHARTNAKLWYHSCGAIRELIPDLIEIGVEIINPVQVSARGMDSADLKRQFGREVVFWGGGCDTQHVLPHGTPEEVRAEVARRKGDLAPGGGFVFTAVHNIQSDVPAANVLAMYEEARASSRTTAWTG